MLLLLFLLSVSSESCLAQYVYGGVVPYDPRYATARRPPVRRSAIEALERLRLPVARFFPQVDTQAARAPLPYQWAPGDVYALPPQWTDDFVQPVMAQEEEESAAPDYANYEYDNSFSNYGRQAPSYAEEVYPQEVDPEAADASIYNDLMSSYLMSSPEQQDMFENVQRRSEATDTGVVQLPKAPESNKKESPVNSTTANPHPTTQTSAPVQMTAVPAAPSKKGVKSLVVPSPMQEPGDESEVGQKEEPLFRPLQSSQRTTWNDMHRVNKNSAHYENPIPLLKQMMEAQDQKAKIDPLLEELTSLKKKPKV